MSKPGRKVPGIVYKQYIQSPEWRLVRKRYFASKLPKICYVCEKPYQPGFHLHHRTYKNLGNEYLRDLVLVCPNCHSGIHKMVKNKHSGIWGTTKKYRRDYQKANNLR